MKKVFVKTVLSILFVFPPVFAFSHCDTLEGPVIKAAREALKSGDINYVLMWVKKENEAEVKKLFNEVLVVRKGGKDAESLADRFFFENLVRIHRAGEGEPYTGIKDEPVEKPIAMADNAILSGSTDSLEVLLRNNIKEGLSARFKAVLSKKDFPIANPEEGREYVEAYVTFMHYFEGIYASVEGKAGESETTPGTAESCCKANAGENANVGCSEAEEAESCSDCALPVLIIVSLLNLIMLAWLLIRSSGKDRKI